MALIKKWINLLHKKSTSKTKLKLKTDETSKPDEKNSIMKYYKKKWDRIDSKNY